MRQYLCVRTNTGHKWHGMHTSHITRREEEDWQTHLANIATKTLLAKKAQDKA